jgi:hypothetical protein
VYLLDEEGLRRWLTWNRTDNQGGFFDCEGCDTRRREEAGLGGVTRIAPLQSMGVWVYGKRGRLVGATRSRSTLELVIDGTPVETAHITGTALGDPLVSWGGLEEGWHRVELTVLDGATIEVDAAEAWVPPVGLDRTWRFAYGPERLALHPDPEEPVEERPPREEDPSFRRCGDCGTPGMPDATVAAFGVILLAARRRHRRM